MLPLRPTPHAVERLWGKWGERNGHARESGPLGDRYHHATATLRAGRGEPSSPFASPTACSIVAPRGPARRPGHQFPHQLVATDALRSYRWRPTNGLTVRKTNRAKERANELRGNPDSVAPTSPSVALCRRDLPGPRSGRRSNPCCALRDESTARRCHPGGDQDADAGRHRVEVENHERCDTSSSRRSNPQTAVSNKGAASPVGEQQARGSE